MPIGTERTGNRERVPVKERCLSVAPHSFLTVLVPLFLTEMFLFSVSDSAYSNCRIFTMSVVLYKSIYLNLFVVQCGPKELFAWLFARLHGYLHVLSRVHRICRLSAELPDTLLPVLFLDISPFREEFESMVYSAATEVGLYNQVGCGHGAG